jgi:hypothetical protein
MCVSQQEVLASLEKIVNHPLASAADQRWVQEQLDRMQANQAAAERATLDALARLTGNTGNQTAERTEDASANRD